MSNTLNAKLCTRCLLLTVAALQHLHCTAFVSANSFDVVPRAQAADIIHIFIIKSPVDSGVKLYEVIFHHVPVSMVFTLPLFQCQGDIRCRFNISTSGALLPLAMGLWS